MVIVVERTLLQPATGAGGIMVIRHVMDAVEMEKKIVMVVMPQMWWKRQGDGTGRC